MNTFDTVRACNCSSADPERNTFDVDAPPERLWLGRKREKNFRPVDVLWESWHTKYPDARLELTYLRPDGIPLLVASGSTSPLTWEPDSDSMSVCGKGALEAHLVDDSGGSYGVSRSVDTRVDDSLTPSFVSESWVSQKMGDINRAKEAAEQAARTRIGDYTIRAFPTAGQKLSFQNVDGSTVRWSDIDEAYQSGKRIIAVTTEPLPDYPDNGTMMMEGTHFVTNQSGEVIKFDFYSMLEFDPVPSFIVIPVERPQEDDDGENS